MNIKNSLNFVIVFLVSTTLIGISQGNVFAADFTCTDRITLDEVTECIIGHMPNEDADTYQIPIIEELFELRLMVQNILNKECNMTAIPINLRQKYAVQIFYDQDNGQEYCTAIEKSDENSDGKADYGWGSFIIDYTPRQFINIQVAHPKSDLYTARQSTAIFKSMQAHVLQIAGTHRNTNIGVSTCQDGYRETDVAHNSNMFFQIMTEEILRLYPENVSIQFHGMGAGSCMDVDAYITHGQNIIPQSDDFIAKIKSKFNTIDVSKTITVPGDTPTCNLHATTNVQGRLINGVVDDLVCDTAALGYLGKFVHIEQKVDLRDVSYDDVWGQIIESVMGTVRADVDQNSIINSTDAMLILRNSLGLDVTSTNWQASVTTGDVNCNGNSNSTDAMLILRQSLGLDMSGTGWCGI